MPKTGDTLSEKYLLTRLIGKGGMGLVFEAEHLELGKKVAIKVPNEDLARADKDLERFKREPRAAAATGHPGIIDIYDIGICESGEPFVVMELLEGESLGELMAKKKSLDVSYSVYIIANVLSALEAAHTKKILHRDLKPDNVFLVETGHIMPAIKILDFGTSKIIGGPKTIEKLTESGTLVGTPFYMAPEQMEDDVQPDNRVDIYAAGVLLYEMLTGKLPFYAENIYALVHKVIDGDFTPPRELVSEIPEQLEAIINRSLSQNRDDRFSSAAAMFQALVPFMDEASRGRISVPDGLGKGVFLDDSGTARELSSEPAGAKTDEDAGAQRDLYGAPTVLAASGVRVRKKRSPLLPIAIGLAIVVAIGVAVGLMASDSNQGDSTEEVVSVASTVASDVRSATDAKVLSSDAATATEGGATQPEAEPSRPTERLVTLTLENLPDGATVLLDGARIPGRVLKLRPHPVAQRLVVRIEDREVQELLTIEQDLTIDVAALMPNEPTTPRAKRGGPSAAQVRRTKTPPSSESGGEPSGEAQGTKAPSGGDDFGIVPIFDEGEARTRGRTTTGPDEQ